MLSTEQIRKEIEEMDGYVPVKTIEESLGMPPTTLQKVLSGKRNLPKKWHKPLEAYFVRKEEKPQDDFSFIKERARDIPEETRQRVKTDFDILEIQSKIEEYENEIKGLGTTVLAKKRREFCERKISELKQQLRTH